jgi:ABC-type multidrug transport system ATPase subunit
MVEYGDGRVAGLVEAFGLGRRYGSRWVFDSLTFSIAGGVVGLLGPNGAGKTTLLETVVTLRRPDAGSIRILGRNSIDASDRREIRRRIGYLPQSFGYPPQFTAQEFVEYVGWTKGLGGSDLERRARRVLAEVGLAERAGETLRRLSGGMLRRVGIASALVNDPELLVLDEPTAGLDPEQRIAFRSLLRRLGESATVLLSTHLVEDVATTCTDLIVLGAGTIAYQGPPEELAAAGGDGPGDSPLERGYSSALRAAEKA